MITINGREVTEVHSLQKFYDYSVPGKPTIGSVYIEGAWENGDIFYCKSDVDNCTVVIDIPGLLWTGERIEDMD